MHRFVSLIFKTVDSWWVTVKKLSDLTHLMLSEFLTHKLFCRCVYIFHNYMEVNSKDRSLNIMLQKQTIPDKSFWRIPCRKQRLQKLSVIQSLLSILCDPPETSLFQPNIEIIKTNLYYIDSIKICLYVVVQVLRALLFICMVPMSSLRKNRVGR